LGLPEELLSISSLTKRQLDSLFAYTQVASGEKTLKEAASLSSPGRLKGDLDSPVTVGSYYRTVSQARENIRESLATALIAIWLGLVKLDDVRRLLEVVAAGSRTLSDDEALRFVGVLRALLDRMVL
jgi:hypothetical protein